jgi:Zn finger protein HypA/HybF involved in hydrogenase expression
MPFTIYQNCSWCGKSNDITEAKRLRQSAYCLYCHHQIGVDKPDCDCPACQGARRDTPPKEEIPEPVPLPDPNHS